MSVMTVESEPQMAQVASAATVLAPPVAYVDFEVANDALKGAVFLEASACVAGSSPRVSDVRDMFRDVTEAWLECEASDIETFETGGFSKTNTLSPVVVGPTQSRREMLRLCAYVNVMPHNSRTSVSARRLSGLLEVARLVIEGHGWALRGYEPETVH
jgi:hypothetical protein